MRKTKILSVIALLLISLLCFASCGTSTPKASDANGTIEGTNITWKFTSSDNTLEISGVGAIPDYNSSSEAPWEKVLQSIVTLEIEDEITKIGNKAFYSASNLKTAKIGKGVNAIGELAFAYTALEELSLEDSSVNTIGKAAFEGCAKLISANTGKSLESLGERAFAFCSSLSSINIPSVVDIKSETFYNCNSLTALYRNVEMSADKVAADAFKGTSFSFNNSQEYSDEEVTITINYVFEDGSKETVTKTENHKIGESYSFPIPTYEGYKADVEDANVVGIASSNIEENTKTVTYKSLEVETVADTDDVTKEPEEPDYVSLVIMIVVVVGVIVGAFFLMKSNKKEEERAKNQNKAKNRKQK